MLILNFYFAEWLFVLFRKLLLRNARLPIVSN